LHQLISVVIRTELRRQRAAVAIENGKERSFWVAIKPSHAAVGIFHASTPALHAAHAKVEKTLPTAVFCLLCAIWLLEVIWLWPKQRP